MSVESGNSNDPDSNQADGPRVPPSRRGFGTPKQDQASLPWFSRLRLVVYSKDQMLVGLLLFVCLVGMSGYFLWHRQWEGGLVEIDHAPALQAEFKIDINDAPLGEMVVLPGVGEKLAEAIIAYRKTHGPFESFEAVGNVPGIGPKKLEKIIPFLMPLPQD